MSIRPVTLLTAALAAGGACAAPAPAPAAYGCLVTPSRTVELGSQYIGVIADVLVERGDSVVAAQPIVRLNTDVERAQVDLAAARAGASAETEGARQALATATRKLERTRDLFQQHFVSEQAVDQAVAEEQAARARERTAHEQTGLAGQELSVAKAELHARTLRSPIDGVVLEVYRHAGERVEEKPVVKVAAVDPLYAEVVLPATLYGRVKAGDAVRVQPELAGRDAVPGVVKLVDQVVEPASNTFRARIVLPNPGNTIPAGIRCQVSLTALGGVASAGPDPVTVSSARR